MEPGQQLDAYRLDALLGEGGMAQVYKAWHTGLHRYEALKLLAPHLRHDREFALRFLQEARTAARLTKAGMIVGTPEYMSPEQAEGRTDTDCRTDLYSLGVVAYEMLCGGLPFPAGPEVSAISLLMCHVRDQPRPPIEWQPHLPPFLNAALLQALAKNPSERYDTCLAFTGAMEADNDAAASGRGATAQGRAAGTKQNQPTGSEPGVPASARRALSGAYAGVGIVALMGMALVGVAISRRTDKTSASDAPASTAAAQQTGSKQAAAVPLSKPSRADVAAAQGSSALAASSVPSVPPAASRPDAPASETTAETTAGTTAVPTASRPRPFPSRHAASSLLGDWTGTFGASRHAVLSVEDSAGDDFTGKMTLQYPAGEVQVAIAGSRGSDPARVMFREVRVLERPASKNWTLGTNTGRLTGADTLAGTGGDGSSRYDWSFQRGAGLDAEGTSGRAAMRTAAPTRRRAASAASASPENAPYDYTRRAGRALQTLPASNAGVPGAPDELVLHMGDHQMTDAELAGKTRWELTVACNQPYAWHGYRFKNAGLAAYFAARPWYQPSTNDAEAVEKRFTLLERRNAHLIRDYITRHNPS